MTPIKPRPQFNMQFDGSRLNGTYFMPPNSRDAVLDALGSRWHRAMHPQTNRKT